MFCATQEYYYRVTLSLLKSTSDPNIVLVLLVMSQVRSITMVLITAIVTIWQSFVTSNKMQDAVFIRQLPNIWSCVNEI